MAGFGARMQVMMRHGRGFQSQGFQKSGFQVKASG